MAIKLSGPSENSVLIDANLTEIILSNTDSQEHFYFAKFFLDDVLFDELIIPRISSSRLILQFSNLLLKNLVFPNVGIPNIYAYRLDKKLRIEVYKNIKGDVFLENTFKYTLRYSTKPTKEIFESSAICFIDVLPDVFVVSDKFTIMLPFYTHVIENVEITVVDEHGHSYYHGYYTTQEPYHTFITHINVNAIASSNWIILKIQAGGTSVTKRFRILRNKLYKSKVFEFRNKFGFLMRAELFGKLSVKDDFAITTYENGFGILKTAEVKEDTVFTIDSGYMLDNERAILSQIINSTDTKIYHNGRLIECVPTVKSIGTFTEGEYVTQNVLTFKLNKNPKLKN